MKTDNYLRELKKIILIGQMNQENEYYDLYRYICETQRDLRILVLIDKIIMQKIKSRKKYLIEDLRKELDGIKIYSELPIINVEVLRKNLINECIEYETIEEIEGKKVPSDNITELEIRIYNQIIKEIDEIEKRYLKESTIPHHERIKELKEQIIKKVTRILQNIEVNGKKLVEKGKIDDKLFAELNEMFDEETLKSLHQITKIETRKVEICYEIKKNFDILDNLDAIFDDLLLKILEEKLKKINEEIIELLNQKKYKKAKKMLISNENFEDGEISLGTNIPEYIQKFDMQLFGLFNKRKQLMDLYLRIASKERKNTQYESLNKYDENELKKEIKKQTELFSIENIETQAAITILKQILIRFRQKKEQDLIELKEKLNEQNKLQDVFEIPKIKEIKTLCGPTCESVMTPLEAIYTYSTLINIDKSASSIESYKELIKFLSEDKIEVIDSKIENVLIQIINEQFDIYFNEVKTRMKTKGITVQSVQKKISYKEK